MDTFDGISLDDILAGNLPGSNPPQRPQGGGGMIGQANQRGVAQPPPNQAARQQASMAQGQRPPQQIQQQRPQTPNPNAYPNPNASPNMNRGPQGNPNPGMNPNVQRNPNMQPNPSGYGNPNVQRSPQLIRQNTDPVRLNPNPYPNIGAQGINQQRPPNPNQSQQRPPNPNLNAQRMPQQQQIVMNPQQRQQTLQGVNPSPNVQAMVSPRGPNPNQYPNSNARSTPMANPYPQNQALSNQPRIRRSRSLNEDPRSFMPPGMIPQRELSVDDILGLGQPRPNPTAQSSNPRAPNLNQQRSLTNPNNVPMNPQMRPQQGVRPNPNSGSPYPNPISNPNSRPNPNPNMNPNTYPNPNPYPNSNPNPNRSGQNPYAPNPSMNRSGPDIATMSIEDLMALADSVPASRPINPTSPRTNPNPHPTPNPTSVRTNPYPNSSPHPTANPVLRPNPSLGILTPPRAVLSRSGTGGSASAIANANKPTLGPELSWDDILKMDPNRPSKMKEQVPSLELDVDGVLSASIDAPLVGGGETLPCDICGKMSNQVKEILAKRLCPLCISTYEKVVAKKNASKPAAPTPAPAPITTTKQPVVDLNPTSSSIDDILSFDFDSLGSAAPPEPQPPPKTPAKPKVTVGSSDPFANTGATSPRGDLINEVPKVATDSYGVSTLADSFKLNLLGIEDEEGGITEAKKDPVKPEVTRGAPSWLSKPTTNYRGGPATALKQMEISSKHEAEEEKRLAEIRKMEEDYRRIEEEKRQLEEERRRFEEEKRMLFSTRSISPIPIEEHEMCSFCKRSFPKHEMLPLKDKLFCRADHEMLMERLAARQKGF